MNDTKQDKFIVGKNVVGGILCLLCLNVLSILIYLVEQKLGIILGIIYFSLSLLSIPSFFLR